MGSNPIPRTKIVQILISMFWVLFLLHDVDSFRMRNFNIDILRMLFAILIVFGHMSVMKLIPELVVGPLVVFFFILTGYFTMVGHEKRMAAKQSLGRFLLSKFLSFFPYLVVAAILVFILQTALQMDYYGYTLGESIISSLLTFFGDISCLSMFGMPFMRGNTAVWYLSGMMIGLAITYPFVIKFGRTFTKYVAPVIAFVTIACAVRLTGTLFGPYDDMWGVTKGLVVSIGSLCLGYFTYECVGWFKTLDLTTAGRHIFGILELGCYVLAIIMILSWSDINTGHLENHLSKEWYELTISFLLFIAVILTCSGRTSMAFDISNHPTLLKVSSFLATGSLVLYLSNYYQIYFVSKMMKAQILDEEVSYTIYILVSFVIVYVGGKYLLKAGRSLKGKLIVPEEKDEAAS